MITLGKHSYHCGLETPGESNNVLIGNYTSIARNCVIDGGFSHNLKNISTYPFHRIFTEAKSNMVCKGDVVIGSDVYIGENVLIMSNVKIGHGAVVAAHAVVTKDVRPYEVVGGVPAKFLKYRFTTEQIEKLLKIEWYAWEDEKIKENAHLIMSEDIEKFLTLHYK